MLPARTRREELEGVVVTLLQPIKTRLSRRVAMLYLNYRKFDATPSNNFLDVYAAQRINYESLPEGTQVGLRHRIQKR